jgi:threonine/homoserine/homoserine lactone efflux protein
VNGLAFVMGCGLGLALAGTAVLLLAGAASVSEDGAPAAWASALALVLGVLLLALGLRQWRRRPRADAEPAEPGWMRAFAGFGPAKAFGAGVVLAGLNPKNLVLVVAGAAAIAETGIPAREQAAALLLLTAIGCLGVAVPTALALALGDRARPLLDGLRGWMGRNNAVITAVIFALIGAKLVGDAISGFPS